MSDIKYDPELPYVVRIRFTEETLGRFYDKDDATQSLETIWASYDGEVIDTTPKPKIPEDAEFVQWDASDQSFYAMRYGKTDAEVTVLVRKGES